MKELLSIVFTFMVCVCNAQVEAKLTYPLVPISDECHQLFDSSDSVIVMSAKDFNALDSLWSTFNSCYQMQEDTLWIKQFEITFAGLMNDEKVNFLVSDGNLKNKYQSSLQSSLSRVQPYDHMHLRNMQFEKQGARYQIADAHIVIDSILIPELDSCWQYFPIEPTGELKHISISKDSLIGYLTDSFGYHTCKNKTGWLDTSMTVNMWIAPRILVNHYSVNSFINDYNLNSSSDFSRPLKEINSLNHGDIVAFRRTIYEKESKYYYTPAYRFHVNDRDTCSIHFNIETGDTVVLTQILESLRQQNIEGTLCFENNQGLPINFRLVLIPKFGPAAMLSHTGGTFTAAMVSKLKKLKSGDKVILEGLNSDDPYSNKKSDYKPIVITLR